MKKIICIVGSLRKDSFNRTIFNEYKDLNKDKFEFTEGIIENMPFYNQDIEDTPESVIKLADQIIDADGIVFFSPEYNYSVPAVLKNALDWVSRDERNPFENKAATIVGASPSAIGTARMQYHLRQIAVFLNLRMLNKPEVMVGSAHEKIKNNKLKDESTRKFLVKHGDAFNKFI